MASVTIQEVRKCYGDAEVLKAVSLDIEHGEFLTLVGPSGCGKSTLLRIIAGLDYQTSGSVHINGVCVDTLRPKHRDIAMVFQSYALYPHLSVADNIALPLRMRRLTWAQRLPLIGRFLPGAGAAGAGIRQDVQAAADVLEIGHLLARKPGQLSGGQRQRVALGRAMVRQPAAFLMDEPLSNLDAKLRVHMRTEIAELHQRLQATFIYVTHDQAEAMTMSDRVAVMMDGELLQVDSPSRIYADPADLRIAEFIGSPKINRLQGTVRPDQGIDVPGAVMRYRTPLGEGESVAVCVRPEHLELRAEAPACGGIETRVRLVENLGADLLVHLTSAAGQQHLIARAAPQRAGELRIGDTLWAVPGYGSALLFDAAGRRVSAEADAQDESGEPSAASQQRMRAWA